MNNDIECIVKKCSSMWKHNKVKIAGVEEKFEIQIQFATTFIWWNVELQNIVFSNNALLWTDCLSNDNKCERNSYFVSKFKSNLLHCGVYYA